MRRADLVSRIERVVAVDDEHVVVRVHAHADDVPEHPVIRQRLGPERIDLEPRRLHERRARRRVERVLTDAKRNNGANERGGENDFAASGHFFAPAEGQSAP